MKLHEYQQRALQHLRDNKNAILSIDMGLGKTAIVVHYIAALQPKTCLIVAPKRVAESVWKQECEKWGLNDVAAKMVVVKGTKSRREKLILDKATPYKVIGRDNVNDVKGVSVDLLIIDELTSFKSHTSGRSKAIATIKADRKIGLTGTFLANGAIDIWAQAKAVGLDLGNYYAWRARNFRDKLAGSGLRWSQWVPTKDLQDIIQPIRDNIFTLTASDYLNIPKVSHYTHLIQLSDSERKAYNDMECFCGGILGNVNVSVDEQAKFAKLQTLANGFIYGDGGEVVKGEELTKLNRVADYVAECYGENEQVLLFYAYRYEAIYLAEELAKRGVPYCSVQSKNFLEKWNNNECGVLFAHPASAGHGLNLQQGGRIIIWSSVTYNYEFFAQANARLARQGQTRPVAIHYFVADGTCELAQHKALTKKENAQTEFLELTKC